MVIIIVKMINNSNPIRGISQRIFKVYTRQLFKCYAVFGNITSKLKYFNAFAPSEAIYNRERT